MPTISSISPAAGPDEGGTRVTITGTGFSAGTPVVDFSGLLATNVVVNSDTELECDTPWELAISPTVGAPGGGGAFTLTGQGFSPFSAAGGDTVTIGGAAATSIVVVSDTEITGITPAGSGVGDVVITIGGTSYTRRDAFNHTDDLTLAFYESRFGTSIGTVEAHVVDATGAIIESGIFSGSGSLADNSWVERSMSYFNPGVTYRIAWHHVNGADFTGDWALDNITINGVNFSFETDHDNFITSSGVDTADSVTAFNNSVLVPTSRSAVTGQWNRTSSDTPSSGTGPSSAQDGTYFVYTEATSPNNGGGMDFWLFSPEITP